MVCVFASIGLVLTFGRKETGDEVLGYLLGVSFEPKFVLIGLIWGVLIFAIIADTLSVVELDVRSDLLEAVCVVKTRKVIIFSLIVESFHSGIS